MATKRTAKTAKSAADAARSARRERMATARMTGESVTSIAQSEGLTRAWASRELAEPETQAIVARLVDASGARVNAMFDRALAAIDAAFEAKKEYVVTGEIEEGGPDHFARLAAVAKYVDLLRAGRTAPKTANAKDGERRLLTLEEIENAVATARSRE